MFVIVYSTAGFAGFICFIINSNYDTVAQRQKCTRELLFARCCFANYAHVYGKRGGNVAIKIPRLYAVVSS